MTTLSRDKAEAVRELKDLRRRSYASDDEFMAALEERVAHVPDYQYAERWAETPGVWQTWALMVLCGLVAGVALFWLLVWAWDIVVIQGLLR